MANLLLRFWGPRNGAITLDGVDLRKYQLDQLRCRIALVAEHAYLFNQTLRANVRLARPEATDREIALAVERAALREFVASLPDGLDTPVGEHGMQLLGGGSVSASPSRARFSKTPRADPRRGDVTSRRHQRDARPRGAGRAHAGPHHHP
jgi:ATP-binding cassette subfamily B protein